MKVDNFVLLIIFIITLIVISLLTQCNKGRLKHLEDKATQEIKETFFHNLGSADPAGSGELGYKITGITEGKYGGRSKQDVLNNIGSHIVNDYITKTELDSYGSALSTNISGTIESKPCANGGENHRVDSNSGIGCNKNINDKLVYQYDTYTPAKYGGSCNNQDIFKHDGSYYEYITDNNFQKYNHECKNDELFNSSLLSITINNDNTLKIKEPIWSGFLNSGELSNILFENNKTLIQEF